MTSRYNVTANLSFWPGMRLVLLLCSAIILFAIPTSCLDGEGDNDLERLSFSRDTVFFDTVFTQIGSSTQRLKLYNKTGKTLIIDEIRLNPNSVFRFNVNGIPGPVAGNIQLLPYDSLFLFIEVTLDPNAAHGVLIYEEPLVFASGGGTKEVLLAVPGMDALYYLPNDTLLTAGGKLPYRILPCNTIWTPVKPVVIVGYLIVDSLCQLEIQAGTQVHFFNNGALWIYRGGTLRVLGEAHKQVVFQGTRLPAAYQELPGQWDRILLNEGSQNLIRNATIKNGFIGLQADHLGRLNGQGGGQGSLQLENVVIRNMSGLGIFSRGLDISGYNVLVSNCGQYGAAFTLGGTYRFYHSTFANYWNRSNRLFPTLFLSNYFFGNGFGVVAPMDFRAFNSIIYGSTEKEFEYDSLPDAPFSFRLSHCLVRMQANLTPFDGQRFPNSQLNRDPRFISTFDQNFRLRDDSPAIDSAALAPVLANPGQLRFDLGGVNRTVNQPDFGAYEYVN